MNFQDYEREHFILYSNFAATILEKYPDDASTRDGVSISFDNTGVVHGEFGFSDALREKKTAIEPWLNDPRPSVKSFAEEHIRSLDLRIVGEQKRAEDRKALRRLRYKGEEDDGAQDGVD